MKHFIKQLLREAMLFKEAKATDPCQCCQYFDFESLNNYSGFEHPIYYMLEKGESHELKHISPKQYIYTIAKGFGVSYEDALIPVNTDNVKKYAEAMKNDSKFPIGFYRKGNSGQEGRHRALALMELGCEEMPIVVITRISNKEARNFVINHKDYSREQLDSLFKSMDYNGISDLDWRSFRSYIDYRL